MVSIPVEASKEKSPPDTVKSPVVDSVVAVTVGAMFAAETKLRKLPPLLNLS